MYVRVVRFTDVDTGRIESLIATIKESDGPPPGVPTTALKMMRRRRSADCGRPPVLRNR